MTNKLEFPIIVPYFDFDCTYTDADAEDIEKHRLGKDYSTVHVSLRDHWKYKEYILQELHIIKDLLHRNKKVSAGSAVTLLIDKMQKGL